MENTHPAPPPPDHFPLALQVAAQCWCDTTTSHLVMEPALADAFARRLAPLMEENRRLREALSRPVVDVAMPDAPGGLTVELPGFLRDPQRKLI